MDENVESKLSAQSPFVPFDLREVDGALLL